MREMISDFPVALVSLAVSGLALVFNMGFFLAVGLDFIPLFSIQEHIVFSMGGALFLLLLSSLMLLLITITGAVSFGRQIEVGSERRFVICALALLALGLLMSLAVFLASNLSTSVSLFMVFGFVVVAFAGPFYISSRERGLVVGIIMLVGASFSLGVFYGTSRLEEAKNPNVGFAIMTDGVRMTLVRAGSQYMLLTSNGSVVTAVKSENVSAVYANRNR